MDIQTEIDARRRKPLPAPDVMRGVISGAGLTVQDVGEIVGASTSAVSRWISGERQPRRGPVRSRFVELLKALGADE